MATIIKLVAGFYPKFKYITYHSSYQVLPASSVSKLLDKK